MSVEWLLYPGLLEARSCGLFWVRQNWCCTGKRCKDAPGKNNTDYCYLGLQPAAMLSRVCNGCCTIFSAQDLYFADLAPSAFRHKLSMIGDSRLQ